MNSPVVKLRWCDPKNSFQITQDSSDHCQLGFDVSMPHLFELREFFSWLLGRDKFAQIAVDMMRDSAASENGMIPSYMYLPPSQRSKFARRAAEMCRALLAGNPTRIPGLQEFAPAQQAEINEDFEVPRLLRYAIDPEREIIRLGTARRAREPRKNSATELHIDLGGWADVMLDTADSYRVVLQAEFRSLRNPAVYAEQAVQIEQMVSCVFGDDLAQTFAAEREVGGRAKGTILLSNTMWTEMSECISGLRDQVGSTELFADKTL